MAAFRYSYVAVPSGRLWETSTAQAGNTLRPIESKTTEPRITYTYLRTFENDRYRVIQPIPVRFERHNSGYTASFEEADLAISGDSKADAMSALEVEIISAFDDWSANESELGVGPAQQLATLRQFVAKT